MGRYGVLVIVSAVVDLLDFTIFLLHAASMFFVYAICFNSLPSLAFGAFFSHEFTDLRLLYPFLDLRFAVLLSI